MNKAVAPASSTSQIISCRAAYGRGGLGLHFSQVVDEARETGRLDKYYSISPSKEDPDRGCRVSLPMLSALFKFSPLRFSQSSRNYVAGEYFDRRVAGLLRSPVENFTGFVGKAYHSFLTARRLGAVELHLHVGNSHASKIRKRHREATNSWGLERSWMNARQEAKSCREYELADIIYVNSEYTRSSFIEAGFAEWKLKRYNLKVSTRFNRPREIPDDEVFRIVYVGAISVGKGVPVLLEAFSRMKARDIRLYLVGGWSSRAMKTYMQQWMARDRRITAAPGDPLPLYLTADVCVHPTYEDGFAYAPAEAMACGLPVIVTEDTGMKELITEGEDGFIVPTGDVGALVDRLEFLYDHR